MNTDATNTEPAVSADLPMNMSMDEEKSGDVDEKLYSRQLYVLGHEAQRLLGASSVLVHGLSGLGVEIAKNLALAGVRRLALHDDALVNHYDLGGNFYAAESDVGTTARGAAVRDRIAELNPHVEVSLLTGDLRSHVAGSGASAVVLACPLPEAEAVELNDACRSVGSRLVMARVHGPFGSIFCDFGTEHTVTDTDGEEAATCQIESVINADPAVVRVLEDTPHGLSEGDVVKFKLVKGMPHLEGRTEVVTKVTGLHSFEIASCAHCPTAATQGYIAQIKQPKVMKFQPLREKLGDMGNVMFSDYGKMERPLLLHVGIRALDAYRAAHGSFPAPGDAEAAEEVVKLATALKSDVSDDEKKILAQMSSCSRAVLAPMCATLGGMAAQEVLKAISRKFTPIDGWFHFDAAETLPDAPLPAADVAPRGSRYDSQVACYGHALQEKMGKLSYFLVGAGAIGCEMLKNWACMGVAAAGGTVYVTDMDRIERSNLSRQFLFRQWDVNSFKSDTAANAAMAMNPGMKIVAHQEKVCSETETLFSDAFYASLDGVCTALDNVQARLYMDSRCVFYQLPMLESGTLGTKGNTQIVVPGVTENYGATRDPPEKGFPVCTVKNFPNVIQHTLQWANEIFEGTFRLSAENVNQYLTTPNFREMLNSQQNTKLDTLKSVKETLVDDRPRSFEDCVVWARLYFERLFNNDIRQLLHNLPEDKLTTAGTPFWGGSKRCPKPLQFDMNAVCEDAEMRNHYDFIVAAANLRAKMYGIKGRTEEEYFQQFLPEIIIPDFTPKQGVKIQTKEDEKEEEAPPADMDVDSECDKIFAELPAPSSLAGFRLELIEFDKDIDEHMLFVTACSNLRAINYQIPTEDTHKSRAIAGRIIPAIATTTALVTGLICLEMYKVVGSANKELPIEAYKNSFLNLAIPFMTSTEPQGPAKTKAMLKGKEWEWSAWDSIHMNIGDITLKEFMEYFEKEYNLEINMLSYGVSLLYSFFANKKKVAERMTMSMTEIIKDVTKKEFAEHQLYVILEVVVNDIETGDEVELPYIKFQFKEAPH